MIPVGVASVEVDEHVMDEVIHVEQRRVLGVGLAVGAAAHEVHIAAVTGKLVDEVCHLVPCVDVSADGDSGVILSGAAVHLRHVPVFFASAKVP